MLKLMGKKIFTILRSKFCLSKPVLISCLLQNKSIAVSHISLSVVKVIAQKCVNILRGLNHPDCTLRNSLSKEQMAELVTTFKDTVTKV